MNLFKPKKPEPYTVIVGCGRLGSSLANTLSDEGGNVLILDKDKDAFRRLSSAFGGLAVVGDSTDLDVLENANVKDASVVVVVTDNDNVNIMVSQLVKDIFHVERVIARLHDPDRECVYKELSIDTVCPAVLSAMEIDKILREKKKAREEEVKA